MLVRVYHGFNHQFTDPKFRCVFHLLVEDVEPLELMQVPYEVEPPSSIENLMRDPARETQRSGFVVEWINKLEGSFVGCLFVV